MRMLELHYQRITLVELAVDPFMPWRQRVGSRSGTRV